MFRRIKEWDAKIGKKIFHPAVIKLCHLLKCNQYRLSRDIWFVVFMGLTVYEVFIRNQTVSWWKLLILSFLFLSAAILKDAKSSDSLGLRLFIWTFILFDTTALGLIYLEGEGVVKAFVVDLLANLCLLLAEYAKTINTIPPDMKKAKKSKEIYHESLVG